MEADMRSKPPGHAEPKLVEFVLLAPPTRDPKRVRYRTVPEGTPGKPAEVAPDVSDLNHFTITACEPTYEGVIVEYRSLPANLPQTYGNSLALWNSTIPNTQKDPIATAPIPTDDETGSVLIRYGFQQTNYSVTYQTKDYQSMCALAQIQLAKLAITIPTYVSICISSLDSSGVTVFYNTLPGYTPANYKNWLGLWQGFESPYSSTDTSLIAPVTQNSSQGELRIAFTPGPFDYTLIYFLGTNRQTAGALLYFQAKPEPSSGA